MVWRGFGFLSFILPLIGIFVPMIFGIDSNTNTTVGCMAGSLIAALVGWRLNTSPTKIEATKGPKTISTTIHRHEAFFLKMEIFSAMIFCLSALTLVEITNPQTSGITSIISTVVSAGLIGVIVYRYYIQKKIAKWLTKASNQPTSSRASKNKSISNQPTETTLKKLRPLQPRKEVTSEMTKEQQRKKAVFAELKNQSGKLKHFENSDHSRYLPS